MIDRQPEPNAHEACGYCHAEYSRVVACRGDESYAYCRICKRPWKSRAQVVKLKAKRL